LIKKGCFTSEEDDNNGGGGDDDDDTIKEDEISWTGNTYWGNEKCIEHFSQET
jgi:hypothetical protein